MNAAGNLELPLEDGLAVRFEESEARVEWTVIVGARYVGHVWLWPVGHCFVTRVGEEPPTYHTTEAAAKAAARALVDELRERYRRVA